MDRTTRTTRGRDAVNEQEAADRRRAFSNPTINDRAASIHRTLRLIYAALRGIERDTENEDALTKIEELALESASEAWMIMEARGSRAAAPEV